MPRLPSAITALAALVPLALLGCGSSGSHSGASPDGGDGGLVGDGFGCLTCSGDGGSTTDGGGNHDRQDDFILLEHFLDRHEGGLGILLLFKVLIQRYELYT